MPYSVPSSTERGTGARRAIAAPLLPFVQDDTITVADARDPCSASRAAGDHGFVHAAGVLQDVADYRGMLRSWFAMLRIGGRLAIEVPHAYLDERALALWSQRHPERRRLYTPGSLLAEVEEALEPNSYRVRLLRDHDDGYDYARDADAPRVGAHAVLLVLERIALPSWVPDDGEVDDGPAPDFAFEPARTRREIAALPTRRRILILKLDHLGDFIMGVPALEQARRVFADAEITLVVGSWNQAMASGLGIADAVIAFDAFPRNSSEEMPDLAARAAPFRQAVAGAYDLAIDLRTDPDTRFFLRHVDARLRAGLGTRAQFNFLDIFLPVDFSRHGFETAWERKIEHHAYAAVAACHHSPFRIAYDPLERPAEGTFMIWGPYIDLEIGDYLYEPFIDVAGHGASLILVDVALDMRQVAAALASTTDVPGLRFTVEQPGARAEFRVIQPQADAHVGFAFYGGRLLRRGADSVLHQSEYLALLIDLIEMRVARVGMLRTDPAASPAPL